MSKQRDVGKVLHSPIFLDIATLAGIAAVAYFVYVFFGGVIQNPTAHTRDSAAPYTQAEIAQMQVSLASSTSVNPDAKPYTREQIAQMEASLANSKSVQDDLRASKSGNN